MIPSPRKYATACMYVHMRNMYCSESDSNDDGQAPWYVYNIFKTVINQNRRQRNKAARCTRVKPSRYYFVYTQLSVTARDEENVVFRIFRFAINAAA